MRFLLSLTLLLLAAASAPLGLSAAQPAVCTAATAVDATIEAIQADYPAWRGKCVRVSGIAVGRQLYADRMALLEPRGYFGKELRRSLFLYTDRGRVPWQQPVRVEAIGAVGSCSDENDAVAAMQAETDDIVMTSGHCHTSLQTYLRLPVLKILSTAPILRLTEAEVPEAQRELVAVGPELRDYALHLTAARDVIGAVADGDRERFQFLDLPERADRDSPMVREARAGSAALFTRHLASRPLFAALHKVGPERIRVFMERERWDSLRQYPDKEEIILQICWCKTASCAGRWPVLRFDADNMPERPWLCVATNNYTVYQGGTFLQARLDIVPGGFAEPRWSRPR